MENEALEYPENESENEGGMTDDSKSDERNESAQAPAPAPNWDKLLTALEALPEQTALAVRAAMPKPVKPKPPENPSELRTVAPSDTPAAPAKRTFAEWWFGR